MRIEQEEAQKVAVFHAKDKHDVAGKLAKIFVAQIALSNGEFPDCCEYGLRYSTDNKCDALGYKTCALKSDTLISQGDRLRPHEHRNDFLKYNKEEHLLKRADILIC